ncbi:MAG: alkyl hydroperoxide reductase subunit F [Bdellovibrionota bacterium]
MLDQDIKSQLHTVFAQLENQVVLEVLQSDHPKQVELLELLEGVMQTSQHIVIEKSTTSSPYPHTNIKTKGNANGVSFSGIPSGHEFSSLILAILHADGKGKLPDAFMLDRIKNLKGPIVLRTIVSLSCENCPDVVQNLNLMATIHPDFSHEMIDGEFIPDEIEELSIQGVPAVLREKKLLRSGKASLVDLIESLEKEFGQQDSEQSSAPKDFGVYKVVVIGGGPAGVSAAIYSARKGLKTLVITDRMGGQLQDTKGIENLISIPYTEGPQLSANLAKHMQEYDIEVLEHRKVESIESHEKNRKTIRLNTGETLEAASVIIATGAKWRELNIPGEKQYLGKGVAFCPHCDGPFYKGKDIAVIGGGNSGVEAAIDLAGIVKSVCLIEFAPELKADQVLVNKLKSLPNVQIITNARTSQVVGNGEKVVALEYEDRASQEIKTLSLDGVFVQIGLIPNSAFLKGLVETSPYGEILVDGKCKTNVEGIFAAGDVTNVPYKQIIVSMGEGAKAALAAFEAQML